MTGIFLQSGLKAFSIKKDGARPWPDKSDIRVF